MLRRCSLSSLLSVFNLEMADSTCSSSPFQEERRFSVENRNRTGVNRMRNKTEPGVVFIKNRNPVCLPLYD